MKNFILIFLAAILFALPFGRIQAEMKRENDLRQRELILHQMEIISNLCPSKSGSVDFEKGYLRCDPKKDAQPKKFRPATMPSDI